MISVKAHFNGKEIVPDEPVDLPKGQQLLLRIEVVKSAKKTTSKSSKKKTALDRLAELAVEDDSLPADLGYQHDHYLYGTPKKPKPNR